MSTPNQNTGDSNPLSSSSSAQDWAVVGRSAEEMAAANALLELARPSHPFNQNDDGAISDESEESEPNILMRDLATILRQTPPPNRTSGRRGAVSSVSRLPPIGERTVSAQEAQRVRREQEAARERARATEAARERARAAQAAARRERIALLEYQRARSSRICTTDAQRLRAREGAEDDEEVRGRNREEDMTYEEELAREKGWS